MKIYISPENRPKPHGPYAVGGVYEHDVCCEIAEYEKIELERCGFAVKIADPDATMATRCKEANNGDYDLYQTLHSNAGGGTGATCLYYGKVGGASYKANQLAYNELTKLYPSKRGIVDGTNYYENANTNMVSVYPEIAFHDNANDAQFILDNKKQIAKALAKAICQYFGVDYVEESSDEPVDNPPVGNDGARLYRVFQQIGAFADPANAKKMADGTSGNTMIVWG